MGMPKLDEDEIEEKIAKEEAEKLRKIIEKEREEPAEVSKKEEGRVEEVPEVVNILASKAAEKYGIDKESVIRIYKEIASEEDEDLKKIMRISNIGKIAEEATKGSDLVKSIRDIAVSKALHKYAKKELSDGEKNEYEEMMNMIEKTLKKTMPVAIQFKLIDKVLNHIFGEGKNSNSEEEKVNINEIIDSAAERIFSAVDERIRPLEEKVNRLIEERKREKILKRKRRIVKALVKMGKVMEKLSNKVIELEEEIEDLKKKGASSEEIEKKKKSLKEMVEEINKVKEEAKELLSALGYEVKKPEAKKAEEKEATKGSDMDDIIKEYLKDPKKIMDLIESFAELASRIKRGIGGTPIMEELTKKSGGESSGPPKLEEVLESGKE